jgi:hypothetical protein
MIFATNVEIWRSAWAILDSALILVRNFISFDSAASTIDFIRFLWDYDLARIMQLTRSLKGERMMRRRSRINDVFDVKILVY